MAPSPPPFRDDLALDKQCLLPTTCILPEGSIDHVPDQPSVALQPDAVESFLREQLSTGVLDKMYEWLWLCAAKDSKRIDTLHEHVLKGRKILPTEDPAMHLIWFNTTVCVKPMPPAITNHAFWTRYLAIQADENDNSTGRLCNFDRKVALGFLRSYGRLIKYPSDLKIAHEIGLLPDTVAWLPWERFIQTARSLEDHEVAKRYHFGQIRLSRLNMLIRFVRPRGRADHDENDRGNNRHYYTMYWNTGAYLRQFVEAGLFVFASVSLILSAMQVVLSLPNEQETRTWNRNSSALSFAFWGFCMTALVGLALSWLLLLGGPILYLIAQQVFGYQKKCQFDKDAANRRRKVGEGKEV